MSRDDGGRRSLPFTGGAGCVWGCVGGARVKQECAHNHVFHFGFYLVSAMRTNKTSKIYNIQLRGSHQ